MPIANLGQVRTPNANEMSRYTQFVQLSPKEFISQANWPNQEPIGQRMNRVSPKRQIKKTNAFSINK